LAGVDLRQQARSVWHRDGAIVLVVSGCHFLGRLLVEFEVVELKI
jgi:hypothetical protein